MIDSMNINPKYSANDLIKGIEILKLFNSQNPTLSLTEIVSLLEVSRTSSTRILSSLHSHGYLRLDEATKRYELTPKVLELGFSFLSSLQLSEISKPYLEQLRDKTGASTHIGVLEENEVVYLARVPARGFTSVTVSVGSRLPAISTAMGKCILAFLPELQREKILSGQMVKDRMAHSTKTLEKLLEELERIHQQGFSFSDGEFENGIRSIAAPIYNSKGQVIAAINVAAPFSILRDEIIVHEVIPAVQHTASMISGFSGNRYAAPISKSNV